MSVLKRFNGTNWEIIGPQITSKRFDDTNHMIAPEYSSTSIYNVGDYVVQSDKLYKCINAIESAEEWTPAHWNQVSIGKEVSDLKNSLRIKTSDNQNLWEIGHIDSNSGSNASGDTYSRIRTKGLIPSNVNAVNVADGYYIWIYCYDSDGVYQGIWKGSAAEKSWT